MNGTVPNKGLPLGTLIHIENTSSNMTATSGTVSVLLIGSS